MTAAVAKGSASGELLRSFIARIEAIEAEQQELADDKKAVYADAKAQGFDTKALRAIIRLRKQDAVAQSEFESLIDIYKNAIGMKTERPLFEHVGLLSVDLAARESVVEAFKELAPVNGEIIVRIGGAGIRLWRTSEGEVRAEDVVDRPERGAGDDLPPPGKRRKPSIIELAAERAARLEKFTVVPKGEDKPSAPAGDPPAASDYEPEQPEPKS